MRICLAQINPWVGDLERNVESCLAAIREGTRKGADLIVLPEMAIPGYPPLDILYDTGFVEAVREASEDLASRARGLAPAIVGSVLRKRDSMLRHPELENVALVLEGGEIRSVQAKRLLPEYDVFFEKRWFRPGASSELHLIAGRRAGILICEDLWDVGAEVHPAAELREAGAELLVSISASPFRQGIDRRRLENAQRPGLPLVFLNACGAQDELIFDGRSFVVDGQGRLLARLPAFNEAIEVVDLESSEAIKDEPMDTMEEIFRAAVLGLRDFARKNRLSRAFLGLSGGVDSAVTAVIAAKAMGASNVVALAMPSRYTDERSTAVAKELAESLGLEFRRIGIERLHEAARTSLENCEEGSVSDENIQARLRMMILMAQVNAEGGMLINTSNKTELALGYSTLYGDMAGAVCPIADLTKPEVQRLARWINAGEHPIPSFTRERPPTAELRPGQVDPFDYETLAPELEELVRLDRSDSRLRSSEHKRRQMGVVLKLGERSFGSGRLIPISRG